VQSFKVRPVYKTSDAGISYINGVPLGSPVFQTRGMGWSSLVVAPESGLLEVLLASFRLQKTEA
jgi:hypothetical protein